MSLKLLFIEPYFGGSHGEFATNLTRYSRHDIDLLTLPACNWNQRVTASALQFSRQLSDITRYDGIIVTSMMRLSDFRALVKGGLPPILVYFHENQLTYPLANGEKRDMGKCIGDMVTALSADRVLFNSRFHMSAFLDALPELVNRIPNLFLDDVISEIQAKSGYLYPGVDLPDTIRERPSVQSEVPVVLWNHRWSYDKNAGSFFYAVDRMVESGKAFELAIVGESSGQVPDVFKAAEEKYRDRLVRFGYLENKSDYYDLLNRSSIVVSTSHQENFGIAAVEAMRCGSLPLFPFRLSYPEIVPEAFHERHLYRNQKEFLGSFSYLIEHHDLLEQDRESLSVAMNRYLWSRVVHDYDREFESVFS